MTRICLQPVVLAVSISGGYGNENGGELTSRVSVIFFPFAFELETDGN